MTPVGRPSLASKMMRLRTTSRCGEVGAFVQRTSCARSALVIVTHGSAGPLPRVPNSGNAAATVVSSAVSRAVRRLSSSRGVDSVPVWSPCAPWFQPSRTDGHVRLFPSSLKAQHPLKARRPKPPRLGGIGAIVFAPVPPSRVHLERANAPCARFQLFTVRRWGSTHRLRSEDNLPAAATHCFSRARWLSARGSPQAPRMAYPDRTVRRVRSTRARGE